RFGRARRVRLLIVLLSFAMVLLLCRPRRLLSSIQRRPRSKVFHRRSCAIGVRVRACVQAARTLPELPTTGVIKYIVHKIRAGNDRNEKSALFCGSRTNFCGTAKQGDESRRRNLEATP